MFSWEKTYTIEDAAEALLQQIDSFEQQAHDLVAQANALRQLVSLTDEENAMSLDEAEASGKLEGMKRRAELAQKLNAAESRIKTAGQGQRPER